MTDIARQLLTEEEARIPWVYPDRFGFWTIGVGHLVDRRKGGHLPDPIIDALLAYDLADDTAKAQTLSGYSELNEVQRAVLKSMVHQLGIRGVRGFPDFCAALAAGDLIRAAAEGLDSKWAKKDTPRRALRQMQMLKSGLWVPFFPNESAEV